jgi:hypothetical protein
MRLSLEELRSKATAFRVLDFRIHANGMPYIIENEGSGSVHDVKRFIHFKMPIDGDSNTNLPSDQFPVSCAKKLVFTILSVAIAAILFELLASITLMCVYRFKPNYFQEGGATAHYGPAHESRQSD